MSDWHIELDGKLKWRDIPESERVPERRRYTRESTGREIFPPCSRVVHQGRGSDPCGKRAVAYVDGKNYYCCAAHLAGLRRSLRNDAKRAAERDALSQAEQSLQTRLTDLSAKLGFQVEKLYFASYTSKPGTYSNTDCVVSIAALEHLASTTR